jgi:hypothetical protein
VPGAADAPTGNNASAKPTKTPVSSLFIPLPPNMLDAVALLGCGGHDLDN